MDGFTFEPSAPVMPVPYLGFTLTARHLLAGGCSLICAAVAILLIVVASIAADPHR